VTREPSVSIVTPCLNQAAYIEATLSSVLDATSPPDEFVVVDGASDDGSAAVVERFADRLTSWVSEPDDGQYDAIQKGFERTTGDVMAWLNAGDLFMPWTLSVVRELFGAFRELDWLTTQRPLIADDRGRVVSCEFIGGFAGRSFTAGVNLPGGDWFARAGIQQESTFWRRELWERAGGRVDTSLQFAGDFELWLRFFAHAELYSLDSPLAAHRVHVGQKTEVLDAYVAEASDVLRAAGHDTASGIAKHTRRGVFQTLGRRPLRRLPRIVAGPLVSARVLQPTRTIVWLNGGWEAVRDYAV
jgi:glycosyltransferase involved in cell wall biosynthesis